MDLAGGVQANAGTPMTLDEPTSGHRGYKAFYAL